MKIVVTCGHPHSGYEVAQDVLEACGLAAAERSRREGLTVAAFHEQVLRAYGAPVRRGGMVSQIAPGRVWGDLAVDLFMGNLEVENWGWADARALWLLEFWRDFDPQTHFVLVYRGLDEVIAEMARSGIVSAEELGQAAASWLSTYRELLRFHQRNRDRSLLVNADRLAATPRQFVAKVVDAFQLPLMVPEDGVLLTTVAPSALTMLLARGLPRDEAETTALYSELEAAADLGGDERALGQPDAARALVEFHELLIDLGESQAAAGVQAQELERLRMEVATLEYSLGEHAAGLSRAEELSAALSAAQKALRLADEQVAQLLEDSAERAKENQLLLLQLYEAQEALAQLTAAATPSQDISDLEVRLQAERQRCRETEQTRDAVARQLDEQTQLRAQAEQRLMQAQKQVDALSGAEKARIAVAQQLDEQTQLRAQAEQRLMQAQKQVDALSGAEKARITLARQLDEQTALRQQTEQRLIQTQQEMETLRRAQQGHAAVAQRGAELARDLDAARQAQTAAETELAKLRTTQADQVKENELLLLQLHQVQEELERYFARSQETMVGVEPVSPDQPPAASTWGALLPVELVLDLTHEIDGDNWYYAESDGRWAGPQAASSLSFPALAADTYEVRLDIVDAMTPEILMGMRATLNGTPLELPLSKPDLPALIVTSYTAGEPPASGRWTLNLEFPGVISPADSGSDDRRRLAIRMRSLRIVKLDALTKLATESGPDSAHPNSDQAKGGSRNPRRRWWAKR